MGWFKKEIIKNNKSFNERLKKETKEHINGLFDDYI